MAYLRFSHSPFYVYWRCSTPDPVTWQECVVDVNCEHEFTAKQVDENIKSIIDECVVMPYTDNPLNPGFDMSEEELKAELKGALERFLSDVKNHFSSESAK